MIWSEPPRDLRLGPADVQVWRASLAVAPASLARLRATLAEDELRRADRFVQPRHRDRFVVARAFLRDVLARHLGVGAGSVRFRYEPAGKPRLEGPGPRFNLSHSGDKALLGVALAREVGVDLEALRPVPDACGLAQRHFAPAEVAALRSVPEPEREAAFLRCWTLKEAYVKAVGGGLGLPLDRFEVDYEPPRDQPNLRLHDETGPPPWTLRALDPGPAYVGALAAFGSEWRLACFDWPA